MLQHQFKAMGGPARLLVEHRDSKVEKIALRRILDELLRIERKFSFYINSSLVSSINNSAGTKKMIEIDDEFASLLHFADTLYKESDGAFDPTAGILKDVWKLDKLSLPDNDEILEKLSCVGWTKFDWSSHSARLSVKGMKIDLGGIVKEYAVDFATKILRDLNIKSALVDLAGDIGVIGGKPGKSVSILRLSDICVATSGDYERALIINGKRYSHLINPKTGQPIDGLASCTVVSEQCLLAGGTATTASLKEKHEIMEWLENIGLPYLAIDTSLQVHSNLDDAF